MPVPITYTQSKDVLTATPPHARLRIELTHDAEFSTAGCSLAWEGDTPINFTVRKPHDRTIEAEATDVLAAVYWSRARAGTGEPPGIVHIIQKAPTPDPTP